MKIPNVTPAPIGLHAEVLAAYMSAPAWADAYNGWKNVQLAIQNASREVVGTQLADVARLAANASPDQGNLRRTVEKWAKTLDDETKENSAKEQAVTILRATETNILGQIERLTSTLADDAIAAMQKRVHEIFDEVRSLRVIPTSADEALANNTGEEWTRINDLVNEYSAITTGYARFFEGGVGADPARISGHLKDPLRDHPYWQNARRSVSSRPASLMQLTTQERVVRLKSAKTLDRIEYGNAYLRISKENSDITFGNGAKPTTAFPVNADRIAWLAHIATNNLGTLHHPDTAMEIHQLAEWSVPNADTADAGATAADRNAEYLELIDRV